MHEIVGKTLHQVMLGNVCLKAHGLTREGIGGRVTVVIIPKTKCSFHSTPQLLACSVALSTLPLSNGGAFKARAIPCLATPALSSAPGHKPPLRQTLWLFSPMFADEFRSKFSGY
jgi:hypothetical protein